MGKSKSHKKRKRSSSSSSGNKNKDCSDCNILVKRMEKLESLIINQRKSRSPSSYSGHFSRSRLPRHRDSSEFSRRVQRQSNSRSRSSRRRSPSRTSASPRNRVEYSRSPTRALSVQSLDVSPRPLDTTLPRVEANIDNTDGGDDALILHNDIILPEDILKIMGKDLTPDQNASFSLHDQLVSIWQSILSTGLKKPDAQSLLNAYQVSGKINFLKPPELNPEVKAALSKQSILVDASYVEMQNQLSKGLLALGKSVSTILLDLDNTPDQFKGDFLTNLCDSGRILANLFHRISVTRKNLLVPGLKISKELADDCLPGEFLFGSNLTQKLDTAKSLLSLSKDLKLPVSQNRPSSSKPATTVRRTQKGRGGNVRSFSSTETSRVSRPLNSHPPTGRLRETSHERGTSSRYHKNSYWNKTQEKRKRH